MLIQESPTLASLRFEDFSSILEVDVHTDLQIAKFGDPYPNHYIEVAVVPRNPGVHLSFKLVGG